MSTEAESPATPPKTPAVKKPAHKDRLLVRGLIGVLLVILVIELAAYGRVMLVHWQLTSELRKAEMQHHIITRDRVDSIFKRLPDEKHMVKAPVGEERYDIYYFSGLLKRRELCVHYGIQGMLEEPEVIEVTTIIPDEVLAN